MGTPLKSMRLFLTPSPARTLRSGTTTRLYLGSPMITANTLALPKLSHEPMKTNLFTKPRARKRLENLFKSPKHALKSNVKINIVAESPIKKAKHVLVLNTPKKVDILKCGLKSLSELNILGRGGFGTVVRGSYYGRDVAVKVIKTTMIVNEKNALSLEHVNVVKTIDVIMKNEPHSIIVTEYLPDSQVLQSVIDNEPEEPDQSGNLTMQNIIKYSLDITAGLLYIHSRKLVHLDLKPANVLVTKGGCKIFDFGSSKSMQMSHSPEEHTYEGTVQYTAPEILTGKPADYPCDTYSLGILMWQLRYHETPYNCLECRGTIIYNVVKYGLRPRAATRVEIADDYSVLYQHCWNAAATSRPTLEIVQSELLKLSKLSSTFTFTSMPTSSFV